MKDALILLQKQLNVHRSQVPSSYFCAICNFCTKIKHRFLKLPQIHSEPVLFEISFAS